MNNLIMLAGIAALLSLTACSQNRDDIDSTRLTNEHYEHQDKQQQQCMLTGELGCAD